MCTFFKISMEIFFALLWTFIRDMNGNAAAHILVKPLMIIRPRSDPRMKIRLNLEATDQVFSKSYITHRAILLLKDIKYFLVSMFNWYFRVAPTIIMTR